MRIEFFMAMDPPTCTHQEKQVRVVNGKPVFYEPPELKRARQKLVGHLAKYRPPEQMRGGAGACDNLVLPRRQPSGWGIPDQSTGHG